MKTKLSFLILLIILMGACSKKNQKAGTSNSKESHLLKFRINSCIDQKGTGIEAFRVLMPEGWQFEGGINWNIQEVAMPATAGCRIFDPHGSDEFEVFPNQVFFWSTNPMLQSNFPAGSRYFGTEVRQPVSALNALQYVVLPRFRQNVSDLKIVEQKEMPELAQALTSKNANQGGHVSSEGAKIRIEYEKNGKIYEEEIYGVIEKLSFNLQSMYGVVTNTNWYIDYLFSFKAEKGELKKNSKLLQSVALSFKLNPLWFSKYSQVVGYLTQQQISQIHRVGELSRILSQTSNQISDEMMASYNQRQEVHDKISENFSDYVRGVDRYYDSYSEKQIELPSGYTQAWSNNLGEYIVSDNSDYNPNIGSNQNWQEMKPNH